MLKYFLLTIRSDEQKKGLKTIWEVLHCEIALNWNAPGSNSTNHTSL